MGIDLSAWVRGDEHGGEPEVALLRMAVVATVMPTQSVRSALRSCPRPH